MKEIKKAVVIGVVMLFLGLAIVPINADVPETEKIKSDKETITLEYTLINDGKKITEKQEMSVSEAESLIEKLEGLSKEFKILRDPDSTENEKKAARTIIASSMDEWSLLRTIWLILKWFADLDYSIGGAFVLSQGRGGRLHLLPTEKLQYTKAIALWHYETSFPSSYTCIVDLLPFPRLDLMRGRQIGLMIGFVGVYLHLESPLPLFRDYTWFAGHALWIGGIDLFGVF